MRSIVGHQTTIRRQLVPIVTLRGVGKNFSNGIRALDGLES